MFGTLGGPELLLIFVLALIVFGPRKLPEIGKSIGKMMAEFRRASNDLKRTIEDEVEADRLRELTALPHGDYAPPPGAASPYGVPPAASQTAPPEAPSSAASAEAGAPAASETPDQTPAVPSQHEPR